MQDDDSIFEVYCIVLLLMVVLVKTVEVVRSLPGGFEQRTEIVEQQKVVWLAGLYSNDNLRKVAQREPYK